METAKRTKATVTYVYDDKLAAFTDKIPNIRKRAKMVHELIKAYGLTNWMNCVPAIPATLDDLKVFHSSAYIDFLSACDDKERETNLVNHSSKSECETSDDDMDNDDNDIDVDSLIFQNEHKLTHEDFGFGYDCPIIRNMGKFACHIAGATLTACQSLLHGNRLAINWCGGWHHAQRDEASGFCTVNDIVLACHALQKRFQKILYIDLDAHHGDGVENAFSLTKNVMTVSLHIHEPGFYPGSGCVTDVGSGRGKYYTVNVPLKKSVSDDQFYYVFNEVLLSIEAAFSADAVVVQCGVDFLNGDPLGMGNLTEKGLGKCISRILELKLPTLFLGGGGYNRINAAKCWAYITSIITGISISSDIPDHSNFLAFGPDYELSITPSPQNSSNSKEYLDLIVCQLRDNLENISVS